MFSSSKTKSIVGLDIEAASIAAVEVRTDSTGRMLGNAVAPIEPGLVNDGEVVDADALGAEFKKLVSKGKLGKTVRLGIANRRVIANTMRLPRIEDAADLEAAVRFRASEELPMPMGEAIIDWRVLDPADPENPGEELEVLLVAAHRDMIERMLGTMRAAGLKLAGIDLAAFGMVRALSSTLRADPEGPAQARLFCNFGDALNLAVARGRDCIFVRVGTSGMETIAEDLSGRMGMDMMDARQWLHHVGLTAPLAEIEGDAAVVARTRDVLQRGAVDIARELRLSLDSYSAQETATPVFEVVATGAGVSVPGLVEAVQADLGLPVSTVISPALSDLEPPLAARLSTAYGLGRNE